MRSESDYSQNVGGDDAHAGESELEVVVDLVSAELPLGSGLRALSEEAPSRRMRRTLRQMSDELDDGLPPEEVFSRGRRGLPHYLRGLVRAGVQTGRLGTYFEEFLLAVRRRRSARQDYWLALAYPLLLVPAVMLVSSTLLASVVPQFKDIFNDFGVELPGVTVFVIRLSDLLSPPVLIGLAVAIPLLPLLWQVLSLSVGPPVWTRFVQALPVIGPPAKMRGMSEFCSFLGPLVDGGLPLGEALDMTADVLIDPNLKAGTRRLSSRVDEGELMQDAAVRLPHFSAELRNQFRWERRGETFGEMLRQAGRVFAARSHVQFGIVGLIFQPLLLSLIGGFLGLVVVALFMPLIMLLNALS